MDKETFDAINVRTGNITGFLSNMYLESSEFNKAHIKKIMNEAEELWRFAQDRRPS